MPATPPPHRPVPVPVQVECQSGDSEVCALVAMALAAAAPLPKHRPKAEAIPHTWAVMNVTSVGVIGHNVHIVQAVFQRSPTSKPCVDALLLSPLFVHSRAFGMLVDDRAAMSFNNDDWD